MLAVAATAEDSFHLAVAGLGVASPPLFGVVVAMRAADWRSEAIGMHMHSIIVHPRSVGMVALDADTQARLRDPERPDALARPRVAYASSNPP